VDVAGLPVDHAETPREWHRAAEICFAISDYEGARTHEARYAEHGERIGAKLAALVQRGLAMAESEYREMLAERDALRPFFDRLFAEYGAILCKSAPGPAPEGLASTGDPVMNRAWTALGVPAITVRRPGDGLPLGLQIATAGGEEALALAAACAWEEAFAR
jgi:Asp-tRNA(Asn)/Glu-tRNA(Gln) amidotransferase A subunit family amidase